MMKCALADLVDIHLVWDLKNVEARLRAWGSWCFYCYFCHALGCIALL